MKFYYFGFILVRKNFFSFYIIVRMRIRRDLGFSVFIIAFVYDVYICLFSGCLWFFCCG